MFTIANKIEQNVVEMSFDNRQFEANVKTSMSTLDKLKQSLSFKGMSKGIRDFSSATKNIGLSGLGSAVDTVKMKFHAMDVVAATALANITNSAMRAGKQLVKSFTIDPVKTGFDEYELKMGSIQTIMAGTGESLETVNKYLDELNTYSDKTIYSFQDMTTNIGKFTNAGVKLDDAVKAIQGISNAAALSGSNANEASHAMYNFAQALSAGYVKLIDWKSIELANMATVDFKNELIKTAAAMGTLNKEGDMFVSTTTDMNGHISEAFSATKLFNESLSSQWLTSEVLIKTLSKYSDINTDVGKKAFAAAQDVKTLSMMMDTLKEAAQSGWAQTWELIVGNFEESKGLWTEFSERFGDAIAKSADARNNFITEVFQNSWQKFEKEVDHAGIEITDVYQKLMEAGYHYGGSLEELTGKERSLSDTMKELGVSGDDIISTLRTMANEAKPIEYDVEDVTRKAETLKEVVGEVIDGVRGSGEILHADLQNFGYDYEEVMKVVEDVQNGIAVNYEALVKTNKGLTTETIKHTGYTEDQIKALKDLADQAEKTGTPLNDLLNSLYKESGRELVIDTMRNALTGIETVIKSVKSAWHETFDVQPKDIYNIIDAIHEFSLKLKDTESYAGKLKRTFSGLFAILDILKTVVHDTVKFGFGKLKDILGDSNIDILEFTANIGDSISKFRDWIKENDYVTESLEALSDVFKKIYDNAKKCFDEFKNIPSVSSAIDKIKDSLTAVKDSIIELAEGNFEISFDELFDMNKIQVMGSKIQEFFKSFRLDSESTIEQIKDILSNGSNAIDNAVSSGFENAKGALGRFTDFLAPIRERIDKNFGNIVAILSGAGLIYLIKKLTDSVTIVKKAFDGISKSVAAITGVVLNLNNVIKSTSNFIQSLANKRNADALFKVAGGIAILVGSLIALSLIPLDKLKQSAATLGILAAGLVAVSIAIGHFGGDVKGSLSSIGLLGFVTSLKILISTLKDMEGLDKTQLDRNMGILGGMIIILGLVQTLILALPEGSIGDFAGIIGLALALKIVVKVIDDIGSADFDGARKNVDILIGIVGSLAVLMLTSRFSDWKGELGLVGVVLAISVFVHTMEKIADLPLDKVKKAIPLLIGIMAGLAIFMKAVDTVSVNAGKAGAGILGMSAALLLMIPTIALLGNMDKATIGKALITITGIALIFKMLIKSTSSAGANAAKAGVTLLAMSGSLIMLTGVIAILGRLDPSGLGRAVAAIAALTAVFSGLLIATHFAESCYVTIGVLTAAVAGLMIVVASLSTIDDPKKLQNATECMAVIMTIFGGLVAVSSLANKSVAALATIAVLTAVVVALGLTLKMLIDIPVDSALAISASLSLLLVSLGAALLLTSGLKGLSLGALITVAAMTAVVGALAYVIGKLCSIEPKNALEISESLSLLLISLSGACLILVGVGAAAPAALAGLVVLTGVIVQMGLILADLGMLVTYIPKAEEFLDHGIVVLQKIGEGLGSFVGGIVEGFAASAMSGLPQIGTYLSDFMANIKGFTDGAKDIDSDSVDGVVRLVEAMTALTVGSVVEKLIGRFTGTKMNFIQFGTQLSAFGEALVGFSDTVKGKVDAESVEAASQAGQMMADLSKNLPDDESASLKSWIFGHKTNLGVFGRQLKSFGQAIVDYSSVVAGKVDASAVENSARAGKIMTELANNLPESDKWNLMSSLMGSKENLQSFGDQLSAFGTAIVGYSKVVSEEGAINKDAIQASSDAGAILVALANSLPEENDFSFKDLFMGSSKEDLQSFGEQLTAFGTAIGDYSNVVTNKTFDIEAIERATAVAVSLADMVGTLRDKNSSGFDLSAFGADLKTFAGNFKIACKDLSKVNTSGIDKVKDAITKLNALDAVNFDALISTMKNSAREAIEGFIASFDNAQTRVSSSGASLVRALANGIAKSKTTPIKAFYDIMVQCLTTVNSRTDMFSGSGTKCVTSFAAGISESKNAVASAVSEMIQTAINATGNVVDVFRGLGAYCALGFAAGIRDNAGAASSEAETMATNASDAAASAAVIASPSKVMMRIGSFFAMGFANGIKNDAHLSEKTAADMANNARRSVEMSLENIQQIINSDLDTQPVIRPVLDMNSLQNDISSIDAMLNKEQSLSIKTVDRGKLIEHDSTIGQYRNTDVVKSINDLRDDLNGIKDVVGNLKVVMDTGTLVGAISKPMDRALGNRSVYDKRGI